MTDKDKENKKDYEVGYRRPPKAHQFKKGEPSKSKGRPKLIKSFKTDLKEELEGIITVQEGGKTKPITKQRALIKKLLAKALGGDLGALRALTGLIALHLKDSGTEAEELSAEDKALLKKYLKYDEGENKND